MKSLITIDNIRAVRPLAKDIPADRINPYIEEAHKYELKRLLGDAFYLDFMAKFDVSADPKYNDYQALLNGSNYAYGVIIIAHPGLIPYMSYHALARFYNNNQINATRYGLTQKNNDQSEQLDPKIVQSAIAELRANALADQADVVRFLTTQGALYPLYFFQDGSALGELGVKFFDPDRGSRYGRRTQNGRTLTSF